MNSGYTTIEIDGAKVGLKFGLPALRQLGEKDKTVPLYDNGNYSDLGIAHIIYAGYCNNQYIKDESPSIPFGKFYEFVEDCISDVEKAVSLIRPVIECFEQSKYVAPLAVKPGKEEDEAKKKSGHGTKSKVTVMESSD